MEIKLLNKNDIIQLAKVLNDLNIGSFCSDEMIKNKIESLIRKNNTHNMNVKEDLIRTLKIEQIDDFSKINNILKIYFSKFKSDDKLNEIVSKLSIKENFVIERPFKSDSKEKWDAFYANIKKYGAIDDHNNHNVYVYDLRKDSFKCRCSYTNLDAIERFLNMKYNSGLEYNDQIHFPYELNGLTRGVWKDYDMVQLKPYMNGYVEVKGKITDLLNSFYEINKNKTYYCFIK